MAENKVFFSIIIPTFNRPQALSHCLTALSNLNFPTAQYEVIIVDDGSSMPIAPLIKKFQSTLNVVGIQQPNSGPATARNNGAAKARGTYLVFTDDDCELDTNYLKTLKQLIEQYQFKVFTGKTVNKLTKNNYANASQLLTDFLYHFFSTPDQQTTFLVSNNFAISSVIFKKTGGFNINFTRAASEDREFGERLVHQGYKIGHQPDLTVFHAHHLNFKQFWKQHFTYGRGSVLYRKISEDYKTPEQKFSPFSFYTQMCLYPFSKEVNLKTANFSALLIVSQIAYILGHFSEKFIWK